MPVQGKNSIGHKIYVYWGGDCKWYPGFVTSYDGRENSVDILYDDEETAHGHLDDDITHIARQTINGKPNEYENIRVLIYCPFDKNWQGAIISDFEIATENATLLYDDGNKTTHCLNSLVYKVIKDSPTQLAERYIKNEVEIPEYSTNKAVYTDADLVVACTEKKKLLFFTQTIHKGPQEKGPETFDDFENLGDGDPPEKNEPKPPKLNIATEATMPKRVASDDNGSAEYIKVRRSSRVRSAPEEFTLEHDHTGRRYKSNKFFS